MSTSAGPMQGASKAIGVAYGLFVFDIPYNLNVNWGGAWTGLDLKFISKCRIPIMMSLASGVDSFFWVRLCKNI